MKLKTILGSAAVAAASAALMSAAPASATTTYSFLDGTYGYFFDIESGPVTTTSSVTPTSCTGGPPCAAVLFTPTTSYDEITLSGGSSFYFAPTAFATPGYYTPLTMGAPASADATAQFSTEITSAAPEPASWAMMIAGVGLAGGMLRYGRRQARSLSAA